MRDVWPTRTLAEVCQIRPLKSEIRHVSDAELVSFVPMEDLGVGQKILVPTQVRALSKVVSSYTYFANGDVLLAKITPCFENGKLGIAQDLSNGIGFGSSEYIIFRPSNLIDKEWLYYFLSRNSFRKEGIKCMSGAVGHKRVSKEFVETCLIPIPSLAEQKHTVTVIDKIFKKVDRMAINTEKNIANARELFEGYLTTIFTKKGQNWKAEHLGKNIDFIDYRGKTPPKRETGIRLITAKNVKMGYIRRNPEEFVDPSAYNTWMTRGFPKKGDILFTTEAPLGNVAQIDTDEMVMIGQRLITFQPISHILDRTFLKFALMSKPIQQEIISRATGATVLGIKASLLKQVPIHFPTELSEQIVIAARIEEMLENCQRLEAIYQEKNDALLALKEAILQKAFAGELTPQSTKALEKAAE